MVSKDCASETEHCCWEEEQACRNSAPAVPCAFPGCPTSHLGLDLAELKWKRGSLRSSAIVDPSEYLGLRRNRRKCPNQYWPQEEEEEEAGRPGVSRVMWRIPAER